MNNDPIVNHEQYLILSKLPAPALAQFIADIYGMERIIDKKIDRLLLQSDKTKLIKKLTSTIKALNRRRKLVAYWEASEFALELSHILSDVLLLADTKPRQCLELLELLMETSANSLSRCEDSNGDIDRVYRSLPPHWLKIARSCYEMDQQQASAEEWPLLSQAWRHKVAALAQSNDFGERDELLPNVNLLFDSDEMIALLMHYQLLYQDQLTAENADDIKNDENNANDNNDNNENDDDLESKVTATHLISVAKATGDVDLFERVYLQVGHPKTADYLQPNPLNQDRLNQDCLTTRQLEEMIGYFYDHQAYDKVFYYLNEVWESEANSGDEQYGIKSDEVRRLDWLLRLYEAIGDADKKLATMSAVFEIDPTPERLRAILQTVPNSQKPLWRDKALMLAKQQDSVIQKLTLLLDLGELELADAAAIEAQEYLADCHYTTLTELLKQAPMDAYLTQVILHRSLLDDILDHERFKAYGYAARYLKQLGRIDDAVQRQGKSYEGVMTHQAYLKALQERHAKNTSFWDKVSA
ncbi:MAG: hypothetical protein Q4P13_05055 [Psychrobacter sp.]|nr:hypothetical protein [Psychrobacter sp.]